jgi:hypothetical protein
MTGAFRLSKLAARLARLRGILPLAALGGGACGSDRTLTEPADPDPTIPPVAAVVIAPRNDSLTTACGSRFAATTLDSAGNVLTGREAAWSSSDTMVATVDQAGMVTTLAPGVAIIAAASEGVRDTAVLTVSPPPTGTRAGFYTSPEGTAMGRGCVSRPWDLATALAGGDGLVRPGDTIWLRGGTYRGGFTSRLEGAPGLPVVVRQYPGDRAVIDGAGASRSTLVVERDYTVFWGFEVTNTDPSRTTSSTSSDVRPNSVVNYGSHTKYVNLVIHDGGVAFYTGPDEVDVEIAGSIIYNNGWQGPDRGHGHGLYLKTYSGSVVARDNVLFNQFGYGIHAYTNAGSGRLMNIRLEGNVAFNNGTLSDNSTAANILLGGQDYASGDTLLGNLTYFSPGVAGTNVQVGYGTLANGEVSLRDNYLVGGSPVLSFGLWERATVSDNVLVGGGSMVALNDTSVLSYQWSGTEYYRNPLDTAWSFAGVAYPLAIWQTVSGLGLSDVAAGSAPAETRVVVRNNPYEAGRATIVVYNWTGMGAVAADLGSVLQPGDSFAVRNVQDLFGPPVAAGIYAGGAITLPMGAVPPPVPIGMTSSRAPATGPAFDVFIVTRE